MTTNIVDNGGNTDKVNTKYEKLAVCITFHYVKERLQYLKTVCEFLVDIAPIVNLTIVTNVTDQEKIQEIELLINKEKIQLEFLKPYGLGHPYLLAWSHLEVFRKKILDTSYTHFLYLEDDIKITRQNIEYWLKARELLQPFGFYPSFFRKELNESDHNWYSSDVMTPMAEYDCPSIEIDSRQSFISIYYPYQGMYLLDRELMVEHLEGFSSNPDSEHLPHTSIFRIPTPQIREKASLALTYINIPQGFRSRNLLPYDKVSLQIGAECMIHHLPNNYTNDQTHPAGKIKINQLFIPKSINTYVRKKMKVAFSYLLSLMISSGK